jgi:uncharacterized membrane protein (DUF2068 family)
VTGPAHSFHAAAARAAAIRSVAFFEAFKGAVVLLAATGLLSLLHKDVHAVAAAFIEHLHLNPASRYPQIILDATLNLHDGRLVMLAAGAGIYAGVRFVEAYGLYAERAWAEVLAAVSGAIYVPFELLGLLRRPTWHGIAFLAINLLVVALMVGALAQRRAHARHNAG